MVDPNIHLDNDSLGIGEVAHSGSNVIKKLIDTVSSAIGILYEPIKLRRLADAKAYEQRALTDAKAYEIKTLSLVKSELEINSNSDLALTLDRATQRIISTEIRRQENIDYIVAKAVEQIQNEKEVADEPVDQDWTTRFINIAQDVSDSEMQDLWAQILTGEVTSPGSYSLRTLECLKNMTKDEAMLFVRMSNLTFTFHGEEFVYKNNEILNKNGVSYSDIQRLVEIGLINSGSTTCFKMPESAGGFNLVYFNKIVIIRKTNKKYDLPIYNFTSVGRQIFKVVQRAFNEFYFTECLIDIKKSVESVEYADIICTEDNIIQYRQPTTRIE